MLSINAGPIRLVDITSYLAGGTSLDGFLKSFIKAGLKIETKGSFPHGAVRSLESLERPVDSLTVEDFDNDLGLRFL